MTRALRCVALCSVVFGFWLSLFLCFFVLFFFFFKTAFISLKFWMYATGLFAASSSRRSRSTRKAIRRTCCKPSGMHSRCGFCFLFLFLFLLHFCYFCRVAIMLFVRCSCSCLHSSSCFLLSLFLSLRSPIVLVDRKTKWFANVLMLVVIRSKQ